MKYICEPLKPHPIDIQARKYRELEPLLKKLCEGYYNYDVLYTGEGQLCLRVAEIAPQIATIMEGE